MKWRESQSFSFTLTALKRLALDPFLQIPFRVGPSAVLFYYPSEGVWVIVPPFPYPPGTAHCPTLPMYCYAGKKVAKIVRAKYLR